MVQLAICLYLLIKQFNFKVLNREKGDTPLYECKRLIYYFLKMLLYFLYFILFIKGFITLSWDEMVYLFNILMVVFYKFKPPRGQRVQMKHFIFFCIICLIIYISLVQVVNLFKNRMHNNLYVYT